VRVVFMGTPAFAVPTLERVAERHEIVAAYTSPDRPAGRGGRLKTSAVKDAAQRLGIQVVQPETVRDTHEVERLRGLAPDVVCVAAYGLLLPRDVLDVPNLGALNVHASLLPKHRGAAPVERAVLEGDDVTGVSIMRMEETLDTGPVAARASVAVDDMTADALLTVLAELGADLLVAVLDDLAAGTLVWEPQDDAAATYAEKITKEDVRLEPRLTARDALRRVRASSKRAAARVSACDTELRVLAARPSGRRVGPGEFEVVDGTLVLGFADGALEILEVHPANRAAMTAEAFVCGTKGATTGSWTAV
jgi:methionyl-tRNA formyltransferase